MKQSNSLVPSMNRRRFLATASSAALAPMIVPSSVLGAAGRAAPSERITMGVVGWGMQGPGNTNAFLNQPDCQVVAACDLDKKHLAAAVNTVNRKYDNQDCKAYDDYREMMARKDIDAVMLAVPDNWHALTAVEAANQGKDIYGEKPLARTIAEQQAIVRAVQQNNRIWQTGSWQRSQENFHKGAEIVRNGLIGKVHRVEVGLPSGHHDFAGTGDKRSITPPPDWLDYEHWIGPSQMQPYIECRVHMNWRWDYNVGGGQLLDWVGHHCDIAHWGMDWDNSGPSEIKGEGEFPPADAIWNTCTKYRIELTYPGGVEMVMAGGHGDIRGGTKWIGSDGWVWVDRGRFDASNDEFKDFSRLPENLRKTPLYYSRNHQRNFLDCVKSRKPTITPVETAHHSAVPGHLGLIAMMVGRTIKWDAAKEQILGDAEATKLMTRPYRAPYKLA
jgi:predicted dehydrogenase